MDRTKALLVGNETFVCRDARSLRPVQQNRVQSDESHPDGHIGSKRWIGLDAKILRPYKQYRTIPANTYNIPNTSETSETSETFETSETSET
jgi:hypothetical protein